MYMNKYKLHNTSCYFNLYSVSYFQWNLTHACFQGQALAFAWPYFFSSIHKSHQKKGLVLFGIKYQNTLKKWTTTFPDFSNPSKWMETIPIRFFNNCPGILSLLWTLGVCSAAVSTTHTNVLFSSLSTLMIF